MTDPTWLDTAEYVTPARKEPEPAETASNRIQVDVAGQSHLGKVRPNNEDHFLICGFGRFFELVQTNLPSEAVPPRAAERGYGMVVADGMGGRAAGEEASRLAISTLVDLVLRTPDWILRRDEPALADEVRQRTSRRYEQVNQTLADEAEAVPGRTGFGTTMTMASSLGLDLFLAHIGDSRAYLLRRGDLQQLTHDHTVAQALVDERRLSRREAATHRLRHVLTQCLGDHHRPIHPDVTQITLEDNDCLLLCTDGLTEMVSNSTIGEILRSPTAAAAACESLIAHALDAGGKDNVTVVVARYRFA